MTLQDSVVTHVKLYTLNEDIGYFCVHPRFVVFQVIEDAASVCGRRVHEPELFDYLLFDYKADFVHETLYVRLECFVGWPALRMGYILERRGSLIFLNLSSDYA